MSWNNEINAIQSELDSLENIGNRIEDALSEQDDYWSWAGFFQDKMDELMPVKDRGKEAVKNLQEQIESLREELEDEYPDYFRKIDEQKTTLKNTVDEIRNTASLKTVALNGEEIAELLQRLLEEFRSISHTVEEFIDVLKN